VSIEPKGYRELVCLVDKEDSSKKDFEGNNFG